MPRRRGRSVCGVAGTCSETTSERAASSRRGVPPLRRVDEDLHPDAARAALERPSDRAVADDAQRGPGDAARRQSGGERPVALADGAVVAVQAPHEGEDHREHVLGDLVGAVLGHVRDRDPALGRDVDGDVVGADAVAADDPQPRAGADDGGRDLREAREDRVAVATRARRARFVSRRCLDELARPTSASTPPRSTCRPTCSR